LVVGAVAAWFAFDQVKETRRDRHIQVLSEFGRRWDEDLLSEARSKQREYDDVELAGEVRKWIRDPSAAADVPILLRVPNYFEDLAIMVECGRLEREYVARSFSMLAVREWEYWERAVNEMRIDAPDAYTEFEGLARALG
jgi:hypothetical protein